MRWNYFKLQQLFYYKVRHGLLQIATGITKCDDYYKLRQYIRSKIIKNLWRPPEKSQNCNPIQHSATNTCIERFQSRDQHLCKFIETKGSVYIRKEFNSHRICLVDQHGRRFIVLEHQYGRRDVM